ncbi:hypothetical protein [Amycolatopsis sp. VC5-11]|uniref:hypothetical protein n=1 Tax=Amycolatopsis sp. VC5-11 TaxID=3120156 RepID=UPI0030095A61
MTTVGPKREHQRSGPTALRILGSSPAPWLSVSRGELSDEAAVPADRRTAGFLA